MTRSMSSERGFSVAEVLVALSILGVGLLGFGSAMSLQGGLASAAPSGQSAVTRGFAVSSATMLAQERVEQVKRLTYTINPPVDQLGTPVPAGFDDEPRGTIAGYPNFSRQVRVETYPAEHMKTVTVTVTYAFAGAGGMRTESLALSTLVAARP